MADQYTMVCHSYVHLRTGRSGTNLSVGYISLIVASKVRRPYRLLFHYTDHRAHRCPHRLMGPHTDLCDGG